MIRSFILLISIGALTAGAAADHLTFLEQSRSIWGSAEASGLQGADSQSDSRHAPDFSLFDADVSVSAAAGSSSAAAAHQYSWMDAGGIHADSTNLADAFGAPNGNSWATGRSYLSVVFELAAPAEFALTGFYQVIPDDFSVGSFEITLDGPSGSLIDIYMNGPWQQDLNETGLLEAGTYTLLVETRTIANGVSYADGSARVNYQFDFTVPEPSALAQCLLLALLRLPRRF